MATTDPDAPILDLSTLIADRRPIRIDGATYHLRAPDELTLAEQHRFTRWGGEIEALGKDPDRDAELQALLPEVSRAALADVPDDVHAKLLPGHHLSIVEVFTVLLLGRRSRLTGAVLSAANPSTGPSSSRGSSTSMAATPDGGSTAPRSSSSGPM